MGTTGNFENTLSGGIECLLRPASEIEVIARIWREEIVEQECFRIKPKWSFDKGSVILIFPCIDSWGEFGLTIPEEQALGATVAAFSTGIFFDLPVQDWTLFETHTIEASSIPEDVCQLFRANFNLTLVQRVCASLTRDDLDSRQQFASIRSAMDGDHGEVRLDTFDRVPSVLHWTRHRH